MDVFVDVGWLLLIQFVVFVDRGYWELLIRVDYIGKNILILKVEKVMVQLSEVDQIDMVVIYENE